MSHKPSRSSGVPEEEMRLAVSFIRLIRLMGPKRKPSLGIRKNVVLCLVRSDEDSIQHLCGLIEWFMHKKKRLWQTDLNNGAKWRTQVEAWLEENRSDWSAVRLCR